MTRAVRLLAVAFAALAAIGVTGRAEARCIARSLPIQHTAGGKPDGGGFLIPEIAGNQSAPIRFWIAGHYQKAHTGRAILQGTGASDLVWLPSVGSLCAANPGVCDGLSLPPELFVLNQGNWANPGFIGCPFDIGVAHRTVAELTHSVSNGSPDHHGVYLIASVAFSSGYDFSRVSDGNGGRPNLVRTAPIPVPAASGAATKNGRDDTFMDVTLTFTSQAKSYGDSGAPNLIKGYEILFKSDQVPVSNFADQYAAVGDPANPSQPLGLVRHGQSSFRVSIPMPADEAYFVSRLVYADSTRVVSDHVSGNSGAVASLVAGEDEIEEEIEEEIDETEHEIADGELEDDEGEPEAADSLDADGELEGTPDDSTDDGLGDDASSERDRSALDGADEDPEEASSSTEAGAADETTAAASASSTDVSLPGGGRGDRRSRPGAGDDAEGVEVFVDDEPGGNAATRNRRDRTRPIVGARLPGGDRLDRDGTARRSGPPVAPTGAGDGGGSSAVAERPTAGSASAGAEPATAVQLARADVAPGAALAAGEVTSSRPGGAPAAAAGDVEAELPGQDSDRARGSGGPLDHLPLPADPTASGFRLWWAIDVALIAVVAILLAMSLHGRAIPG